MQMHRLHAWLLESLRSVTSPGQHPSLYKQQSLKSLTNLGAKREKTRFLSQLVSFHDITQTYVCICSRY